MKMKVSIGFALMLLASSAVSPAMAEQATYDFYASHTGWFQPFGGFGESPLFGVVEGGTGEEYEELGSFEYATSLTQRIVRDPADFPVPNCAEDSSFAVDGLGILVFDDGELHIKRISGTACLQFPYIILDSKWVITSGTGKFAGASGKLSRSYTGSLFTLDGTGTFEGTIKLVR